MPSMGGLDLLRQLHVKKHLYEAIVMTGHESLQDARNAMELGAVSYVGKPVKHEELMRHVRAALEQVAVNERELAYRENLEREVRARTKELEETLRLTEFQSRRLDMRGLVADRVNEVLRRYPDKAVRVTGIE